MLQKSVEKLKKELTSQIRQQWDTFPHMEHPDPPEGRMLVRAEKIADYFEYDDNKEKGQHTPEHGQLLSARQVRWLLTQADDIFEKHVVKGKERWLLRDAEPAVGMDEQ